MLRVRVRPPKIQKTFLKACLKSRAHGESSLEASLNRFSIGDSPIRSRWEGFQYDIRYSIVPDDHEMPLYNVSITSTHIMIIVTNM